MSVIELENWIAVQTPLGRGHAVIFESTPDDNFWTVIITGNLAIVTFKQKEIRAVRCYTLGSISHEDMKEIIK
jgi:hypothetical protein